MARLKKNTCAFPGCFRHCHGQGLCVAHYRQRRRGQRLEPLGRYGRRQTMDISMMEKRHFISLGGGVQSTVMTLMADRGLLGDHKVEAAIFADTQWEPSSVYETVDWLKNTVTSFPVEVVTAGNLKAEIQAGLRGDDEDAFVSIPVFARKPDGKLGISIRQCTSQYKIQPVEKEIRRRLGVDFRRRWPNDVQVMSWLGISLDEAPRRLSQNPREPRVVNHYPLVDRKLTRQNCRDWFEREYPGRPLHRSSCVGCPYHGVAEHARMALEEPQEWADVVEMDRLGQMQNPQLYFSSKGISLDVLVSDYLRDGDSQPALFEEECTGYCHT